MIEKTKFRLRNVLMRKYYKFKMMLLSVMIVVILSACGTEKESDSTEKVDDGAEIVMPHDDNYYTGHERPVGKIVEELEEIGFVNIKTIEDEPRMYHFSVESVEIFTDSSDKKGSFDEGDAFSANDLVEIHYYGGPMEDGMIQDTNIFTIEEQLKNIEGYTWSEDHGVIEGKTGYFGTCLCEENDIWVDLYGNDLEEIESASIKVHDEDYDVLLTFASFFETSYIKFEDVEKWIKEYSAEDGYITEVFGDAEFCLEGDSEERTVELSVFALE